MLNSIGARSEKVNCTFFLKPIEECWILVTYFISGPLSSRCDISYGWSEVRITKYGCFIAKPQFLYEIYMQEISKSWKLSPFIYKRNIPINRCGSF